MVGVVEDVATLIRRHPLQVLVLGVSGQCSNTETGGTVEHAQSSSAQASAASGGFEDGIVSLHSGAGQGLLGMRQALRDLVAQSGRGLGLLERRLGGLRALAGSRFGARGGGQLGVQDARASQRDKQGRP